MNLRSVDFDAYCVALNSIFARKRKTHYAKTIEPTKAFTKTLTTADSVNEVAANTYGQP